jgi:glutathione S-transferase
LLTTARSTLEPQPNGSPWKNGNQETLQGRALAAAGLEAVKSVLAGRDYAVGPFSIADAALFYVEFWTDKTGMALPPNCLAHYQRMKKRPAVAQVLAEEGYR